MPWRLGRVEEARRELENASTFPYEFDIRNFLSAFSDRREADELLNSLERLGFDPAVSSSPILPVPEDLGQGMRESLQ
jgi:hypothetical protein